MRLQHVSYDIKNIIDQVDSHWELLISEWFITTCKAYLVVCCKEHKEQRFAYRDSLVTGHTISDINILLCCCQAAVKFYLHLQVIKH